MEAKHTPPFFWNARQAQEVDPRGPLVTSVAVERNSGGALVTYSCGHIGEHAQHFHHVVGDKTYRCFKCGQQARAAINKAIEQKGE